MLVKGENKKNYIDIQIERLERGEVGCVRIDNVGSLIISDEVTVNGARYRHFAIGDKEISTHWVSRRKPGKKIGNYTGGVKPYTMVFHELFDNRMLDNELAVLVRLIPYIEMGTGLLRDRNRKALDVRRIAKITHRSEQSARRILLRLGLNDVIVEKDGAYYANRKYLIRGRAKHGDTDKEV